MTGGRGMGASSRTLLAAALAYAAFFTLLFSPVLLGGRLLAPGDGITQNIPSYEASATVWTPLLFSGYPIGADPQALVFYPPARICRLLGLSFNVFVMLAYVIAATATFAYVRAAGTRGTAALAAGLCYGASGSLMAHLGHTNMVHAAAWLPAVLLGVDGVARGAIRRGVAVTGTAVALMALAGHPQTLMYGLMLSSSYALFRPRAGQRRARIACALGAIGCGLLVAAPLLVPMRELALESARAHLDYGEFAFLSLQRPHLLGLLVPLLMPAIDTTELTTFVGLLPLGLALYAMRAPRTALTRFWIGTAAGAIALALAPGSPAGKLLYQVPVYNQFRASARWMLIFSLAVAVLAAHGIEGLMRLPPGSRRRALAWVGFPIAAAGALLAVSPHFRRLARVRSPLADGGSATAVLAVLLILSILGAAAWLTQRPRAAAVLLVLALTVDLAGFAWFCEWRTAAPPTRRLVAPAYLDGYRAELLEGHGRMVEVSGADPRLRGPAPNLSLLWGMPSAAGYNPLILDRYARFFPMSPIGNLYPQALADGNHALDLASVRLVFAERDARDALLPEVVAQVPDPILAGGLAWTPADLGISIDPGGAFTMRLPWPMSTHVGLVLEGGDGAEPRASIDVITRGGAASSYAIPARPTQPPVTVAAYPGATSGGGAIMAVVELDRRRRLDQLTIANPASVSLRVSRITLFDAPRASSFRVGPELLPGRTPHFERRADHGDVVVYENTRALPRAFLVAEWMELPWPATLSAVQGGTLPDGSPFDPRSRALVEPGHAVELPPSQPPTTGPVGTASITSDRDLEVEVEVDAHRSALLILADTWYPGWRARVDGADAPMLRADGVLRAVAVPAGSHVVSFRYRPASLLAGCILALAGVLLLGAMGRSLTAD